MVIHAIYENGVFRPVDAVELPDNTQVELEIHSLSTTKAPQPGTLPLVNLAAIAHQLPENPDLPTDLGTQHDHYLYGLPKQT